MTDARIRVGLVDSGVASHQLGAVTAMADFIPGADAAPMESVVLDRLGHGSTLAEVLITQLPGLALLSARIFDRRLAAGASQAAAAIDWLVEQEAQVINLSFGIRPSQPLLQQACTRAQAAGVVLVASAPAMGAAVYPAAYPGVIRVTGDARCAAGEHSWCPSPQADFGACVRPGNTGQADPQVVGASVATAYLSAQVGRYLQLHAGAASLDQRPLRRWLAEQARYRTEQRTVERIPWSRRLNWAV